MSNPSASIPRQPVLKPAEDYYRLRREGIGLIEQMGSRLWTDYNTHDPGITILEALCYAITDLSYRTGWDIRDILATETAPVNRSHPYPDQAFFTAREILTVNPATPDDFRRLLIDLDMVRNAWIACMDCQCETGYYAWCEKDRLQLSFQQPDTAHEAVPIASRGMYEVLLELEADPELGDLNDHKIEYKAVISDSDGVHPITFELRFSGVDLADDKKWAQFMASGAGERDSAPFSVKLKRLGATRSFDLFTDPSLKTDEDRDNYLRAHWRGILYLDLEIRYSQPVADKPAAKATVSVENVAMRVFSDATAKNAVTALFVKELFNAGNGARTVIQRYCRKTREARAAVAEAKVLLQAHRNLGEDYCRVVTVGVEDVAVCADIVVKPDADIELVQACVWFEIERYFNPPAPFHTLEELLDKGVAVEDIFNGPELDHGFILAEDLEATSLKSVLCVSDIINRLMDIDGVLAVNRVRMVKYDAGGNVVKGVADPTWGDDGKPLLPLPPDKTEASWMLYLSRQHQPRFYTNASCILFYKNGLPFLPRMDEARDTLIRLRGEAERPKIKGLPADLPIPAGTYRNPEDCFPVQYSFPLTYATGPDGLPSHATTERRAQAMQLKAYLMVFEQILGNAFAQVAHAADLFSLDAGVERTYFVREFGKSVIRGYDEIVNGLDRSALEAMTETAPEFHERRNRFLDHIMARFGEQFNEYALLLTDLQGRQVALDRLIQDKIEFIKEYPLISHDRARAFDYTATAFPVNQPGITKRINRLLGQPDLQFTWVPTDLGFNKFRLKFHLKDRDRDIWTGYLTLDAVGEAEAETVCRRAVLARMSNPGNFRITRKAIPGKSDQFILRLKGKTTEAHGRCIEPFATEADVAAMREALVTWSAGERMILVEHLLLRPKFSGDALYPACTDGPCYTCGDEDPYSFRLSFVMPGWTAPFNTNMEMRNFAERSIRQETPSHLLAKICWVGNDTHQFDLFEQAWYDWLEANAAIDWTEERLQERVEAILTENMALKAGKELLKKEELRRCAAVILTGCAAIFHDWMEENIGAGRTLDQFTPFPVFEIKFCADFNPPVAGLIKTLLDERYRAYTEVSYRLWNLVGLLAGLSNTYPPATLHDWDEGSDQNPVRLGKTALGN